MKTNLEVAFARGLVLAGLSLSFSGCSGGSGGSGHAAPTPFTLDSVSVADGSVWQINHAIELRFSKDVDFASVNTNTIQIGQPGGAPAAGEFRVGTASDGSLDPTVVVFAPRCPTLADFSDAGLLPGGLSYVLQVVGGAGLSVVSSTGQSLDIGLTVQFTTPASSDPSVIFLDTQAGPPAPVVRSSANELDASYLELGGSSDPSDRVYFQPRSTFDPELGADVPAGFLAPLNLYSSVATRLSVLLVLDQAIDAAATNYDASRIRLEYLEGSSWIPLAHTVALVANCTQSGALLRVSPTGILPQGRTVRVVCSAGLRDIVGDPTLSDSVLGSFLVQDSGGADEWREEFSAASGADTGTQLGDPVAPPAQWGGGVLEPGFDFAGTGGPPDGQFDWEIGSSVIGSPPVFLLFDTTYMLITDSTQSRTEVVIDGVVDVRDFIINEGSSLTAFGPNAIKIYASRNVVINGSLLLRGNNDPGVSTLNTTCITEQGANGGAGGGKGGDGNPLTSQSSPKGGDGVGPFGLSGGGGGGGHTAYKNASDELRRPGGGGGGALGRDVMEAEARAGGWHCPDQSVVGLDVEQGFPGYPTANDAILGAGVKPVGGTKGAGPFGDGDPNNDFFGLQLLSATGEVVQGELTQPTAGSGGGGGGNTCNTSSFPTTPFTCSGDEKGAGGGGGGGSLWIVALGDINLGSHGKIDATGGAGGGGENSLSGGITRIGGGSGGGSGGHIILESAGHVDLSNCVAANGAGIFARGGQGGAGKNDLGGAHAPGTGPYIPSLDALPPNSYPTTGTSPGPCRVTNGLWTGTFSYTFTNTVGNGGQNDGDPENVVTGCGGDGGPGIIQIHVQRLSNLQPDSDLKLPGNTTFNPLRSIVSPTPVGATPSNIQVPGQWDRMLPQVGRYSTGLSSWIPLSAANVTPGSPTPHALQFRFGGTDSSSGLVQRNGGSVTQLPAILAGLLAAQPSVPFVSADKRSIVFDASGLDPLYLQNPNLMLRFGVQLTHAGNASEFEVVAASLSAGLLRLSVAESGAPLQSFVPGDAVGVIPRFFRVSTAGVNDALPASAAIQVRFQAAPADASGNPTLTGASGFLADASAIQNDPNAANFVFVRFRVDFDLQADGSTLTLDTPRPKVDFLRLPFKF